MEVALVDQYKKSCDSIKNLGNNILFVVNAAKNNGHIEMSLNQHLEMWKLYLLGSHDFGMDTMLQYYISSQMDLSATKLEM